MPSGRIAIEVTTLYEADISHPNLSVGELGARFTERLANSSDTDSILEKMENQGYSVSMRGITEIHEKLFVTCTKCDAGSSAILYDASERSVINLKCKWCKGTGMAPVE